VRVMRIGFTTVVVAGHALVLVLAFWAAGMLRFDTDTPARWTEFFANPWLALAGYVVLALLIFQWSGLYRFDARWTMRSELRDSLKAVGLLAIATLVLLYLFKLQEVSRGFLAIFFVLTWAGISLTTVAVRKYYARRRSDGKGVRHVLLVGTDPSVIPLMDNLVNNHPDLGITVAGYLGFEQGLDADFAYLGKPPDLQRILQERVIDEVIVALKPGDLYLLDGIVQTAQEQGKTVRIPLPSMGYSISEGEIEHVDSVPLLTVTSGTKRTVAFASKRIVDLTGSFLALVFLGPVMAVIALIILIRDGRPIIFADRRAGIHGRPITVHKFRTMVEGASGMRDDLLEHNERVGPAFKMEDDPRITSTGSFLRSSSLDELPQFWDVFVGRMSIVGPRPQVLVEVADYDPWHRKRLSVKPGVTGLWQVTARQDPSFETWAKLDLEYIDNWSPALDVKIMLQTIPAIIKSTGS